MSMWWKYNISNLSKISQKNFQITIYGAQEGPKWNQV